MGEGSVLELGGITEVGIGRMKRATEARTLDPGNSWIEWIMATLEGK